MIQEIKTAITFATICLPIIALSMWAIIDAAGREFGSTGKKALWMMIAAIPFIGFIFYLAIGRWKSHKPENV
jgi:Zn-dependent protease with chaperone function